MNHYIITAYEDMAKERFAELQKEAEIRRRIEEAKRALPKKPSLFARFMTASLAASRAFRGFILKSRSSRAQRYANRAA